MTKEYLLSYCLKPPGQSSELSLYDIRAKKQFLKRGVYEPVLLQDLHVDGLVTICSRKFKITAYADSNTKNHFEKHAERVSVTIGPEAFGSVGNILNAASERSVILRRTKTLRSQQGLDTVLEFMGANCKEIIAHVLRGFSP